MDLEQVSSELRRRAGIHAAGHRARAVSGGSIHQAYYLPTDTRPLFVKINRADALAAFEAEADGLGALRAAQAIAVPDTVDVGCAGATAYLALGWIETAAKTAAAERSLGTALGRQHRVTAERFGYHRDNTIGATPQRNTPASSWLEFLRSQRLGFQLRLAAERGLPREQLDQGRRLLGRLERFFEDHRPAASLLHGDLWSGNWASDAAGKPYIYDPAVYYGDREADLAMTRLFGGFGEAFYAAYATEWPLATGWQARVELYNLYHLLNHFNLFGASYLGRTARSLAGLLRACA